MVTETQKNKKQMLKNIKDLVAIDGKKGLIHLDRTAVGTLEKAGYLSKIEATHNVWHQIPDIDMSMLEVTEDYYKLVSTQDAVQLDEYCWSYDGRNAVAQFTNDSDARIKIGLERAVLNINAYGNICLRDTEEDAHHMWLRCCALPDMLISMDRQKHLRNHQLIGNYDRSQCIVIRDVSDLERFVNEVVRVRNVLENRIFSLEL